MSLQDKINNAKETPWLGYYRPKKTHVYSFGGFTMWCSTVTCHTISKWLCIGCNEHVVRLRNKNTTIVIPKVEFELNWVEWKEKKCRQ